MRCLGCWIAMRRGRRAGKEIVRKKVIMEIIGENKMRTNGILAIRKNNRRSFSHRKRIPYS